MRLIDADALCKDGYHLERVYQNDAQSMIWETKHIEDVPTVDAEPVKHGEWVKMRGMMPPEYMGLKECNKCGWHIDPLGRTAFDKRESEFRYCPRCGAKMNNQFAKGGKKVGDEDAAD